MNYGLKGVGDVEDVDEDSPPQDGKVVGDDDDDDTPSGREVPLAESLHRRAKVLLPKFHLETAVLHPKSTLLIFLGQNDLNTRRGAPEVGWAKHNPPGRAWGPKRALVSCAHQLAPPPVVICSSISYLFHKKST